ncbi:hypothetical protein MMC30_006958 [Trapelia coarctata]|nr:hypothetical protein [Trapelia coarctata]
MPAPLAKGLIISISILIAAGFAVYENPQVRHWVDESRRKIAIALHSLGDEIQPLHPSNSNSSRPSNPNSRRSSSNDASTREDDSAEAVERRRRAREEILERGRMMEEKRRAKSGEQSEKVRGMSFDDIVDQEGKLKKEAKAAATTTAASIAPETEGLRHRNAEANVDPFSDEKPALMDFSGQNTTHETTSPLPNSRPDLLIDTSSPPPLTPLDLTPIALASSNHTPSINTPTSPTQTPNQPQSHQQPQSDTYFSVSEWAENSTSFYSPPRSVHGEAGQQGGVDLAGLEAGMEELVNMSDAGMSDVDMDIVSEVSEGEGRSTPGSWTEVGSVVSEND